MLTGTLGAGASVLAARTRAASSNPLAAALRTADGEVRRFYKGRSANAWSRSDAAQLDAALAFAARHALDPTAFSRLLEDGRSGVRADVARTRTALAYGAALSRGLVDPREVFGIYTVPRPARDVAKGLAKALLEGDVGRWLDGLPPRDSEYAALSSAFQAERERSQVADMPLIPPGATMRPGLRDLRVSSLRRRLGLADADAPSEPRLYGPEIRAAVESLQRDHGLKVDGVVGPHTLAALNAGPKERTATLALALERRRWLVREPPPERIDVNTAACTLTYFREGEPVTTSKVVCGRPGHETPELQAAFDQLVVNPPWNVPSSIARAEINPRGAGYLERHHMHSRHGRIVQEPGPWAALGAVKFDMQDPYAIYLHDTPSKDLFDRSQRHLSHGCVRVEGAVEFARRLAESAAKSEAFDAVLSSGDTNTVELSRKIPVRLLYRTASLDAGGTVRYRADTYGWDEKLGAALGVAPDSDRGEDPEIRPLGP